MELAFLSTPTGPEPCKNVGKYEVLEKKYFMLAVKYSGTPKFGHPEIRTPCTIRTLWLVPVLI